jgi:hypothetical protein
MRAQTVYSCSIATFTSLSNALDLGQAWDAAYLVINSMTSNSQHFLRASPTLAGTYSRVKYASVGTSSVQTNDWAVASAASSAIVPIPQGLRYIKVETSAICSFSPSYDVIVSGG